ncbi:MAG: hypothetical protein HYY13_09705 [Nitrospirae bacterium]|nr:hypothetical protein [Nitrospirota bacterium]
MAHLDDGFKRFMREHGRLPDWKEVNACSYLPSTRQIQDRFGGLTGLKKKLGYADVSFGTGTHRSAIASRTGSRGLEHELRIEGKLIERFGEVFVHGEKRIGATRKRVDFFVFTADGPFAVDVFDSDDIHSFIVHLNIKLRRYEDFPSEVPLLLVCMNQALSDDRIEAILAAKERKVPESFRVLAYAGFLKSLHEFRPHKWPM